MFCGRIRCCWTMVDEIGVSRSQREEALGTLGAVTLDAGKLHADGRIGDVCRATLISE